MADAFRALNSVFLFSREGARSLDRAAIEEFGLPGVVLMENAASALHAECLGLIEPDDERAVYIACGPGANGGDGFALARWLHNSGVPVAILLLAPREQSKGDAATMLRVAERMSLPMIGLDPAAPQRSFDAMRDEHGDPCLVVDALFGTGLDRPLGAPATEVVVWINRLGQRAAVLSVDVPTGLDCETGQPLGDAVKADLTLTLAGPKLGFEAPGAEDYLGEVVVGDIGVPLELLERHAAERLEAED